MDNRAIGIFDSGLGGLTAVAALRELMPRENIVYFADSARVPYGAKSRDELLIMARQDLELMASFSAKFIIAACGTVSSNASQVIESFPIPSLGVLKPGIQAMSRIPGSAPLGIIATAASIKAGAFRRELEKLCPGREIVDLPCPDFVPLIESGHTGLDDPELREAVERSLAPAKAAGIAALLLGCTHYGIIAPAIQGFLGDGVELVSASESAAQAACRRLSQLALTGDGSGETLYYTSGNTEEFSAAASRLLGREIHALHVPVMKISKEYGDKSK